MIVTIAVLLLTLTGCSLVDRLAAELQLIMLENAIEAGDAWAAAGCFTDDAVLYDSDYGSITGSNAIRNYFVIDFNNYDYHHVRFTWNLHATTSGYAGTYDGTWSEQSGWGTGQENGQVELVKEGFGYRISKWQRYFLKSRLVSGSSGQ